MPSSSCSHRFVPLALLFLLASCSEGALDTLQVLAELSDLLQSSSAGSEEVFGEAEPVRSPVPAGDYPLWLFAELDSLAGAEGPLRDLLEWAEERRREGYLEGEKVVARQTGSPGIHFWTVVQDDPLGVPTEWDAQRGVLLFRPVRITAPVGSAWLAHELARARYDLSGWDDAGHDAAGEAHRSERAVAAAEAVLDSATSGALGGLLRTAVERQLHTSWEGAFLQPDERVVETITLRLGESDPWEGGLRHALLSAVLSRRAARSETARAEAMLLWRVYLGEDLASRSTSLWTDHSFYHAGLDVGARVGEGVPSPISGRLSGFVHPAGREGRWGGVVIAGTGRDADLTVRVLGISSRNRPGALVDTFAVLGEVLDPGRMFEGVRPHLHLEVYEGGVRIDASGWMRQRAPAWWAARVTLDPLGGGETGRRRRSQIESALRLERAGRPAEALRTLLEVEDVDVWELPPADIYHHRARLEAEVGVFEEAAVSQRALLRLLDLELEYSAGSLPAGELGATGTCRSPASLRLLISRHEANLRAYEVGRAAIFVYY